MVWLLMEALFVSATPALEALTALNSRLIVLQMLTGMYINLSLPPRSSSDIVVERNSKY